MDLLKAIAKRVQFFRDLGPEIRVSKTGDVTRVTAGNSQIIVEACEDLIINEGANPSEIIDYLLDIEIHDPKSIQFAISVVRNRFL